MRTHRKAVYVKGTFGHIEDGNTQSLQIKISNFIMTKKTNFNTECYGDYIRFIMTDNFAGQNYSVHTFRVWDFIAGRDRRRNYGKNTFAIFDCEMKLTKVNKKLLN
jgi:hypothetical protein